jgi:hypothetical protein
MQVMMKFIICLLITVFTINLYGTHATQAHFEYVYAGKNSNGDNKYLISLRYTRDCLDGKEFADYTTFGIYLKSTGKLYTSVNVTWNSKTKGPDCLQKCREKATYEKLIELPVNQDGYYVTNEACCRISSTNLKENQSGHPDQGTTAYCYIPGTIINSNSNFSIGEIRVNPSRIDTIRLFTSDNDKDINGKNLDSMVISIVPSRTGASLDVNQPPADTNLNISDFVTYNSGFSNAFPLGNTSIFKLDQSGKNLIVKCTTSGTYFVAFEVTEFRNGVIVGKTNWETMVIVAPNVAAGKFHVRGWTGLDPISKLQWFYCMNNVKYHIVEKSTDSVNYKVIDTLDPEENYYVDRDVTWKRIYHYRVRSVMHDGSVLNSDTAIVQFWGMGIGETSMEHKLSVYPVPVSNICRVSIQGTSIKGYSIMDQTGRIIMNKTVEEGSNSFEIDCSEMSTGVYFIRCTTAENAVLNHKILKQ